MEFRDLTAEDIEVRVQSAKANGVVLLLYKNARVDMNVLDETVHPENWQRLPMVCKDTMFCRVGINTNYDKPEAGDRWVWKADAGTESNTEAQKGEASDSFKRACFNWGIGRELYTSPFIWVKKGDCSIIEGEKNGRKFYACYDQFEVEKIKIENKRIVGLAIKNATTGKRCFVWQP
jgi:hypothetical protein